VDLGSGKGQDINRYIEIGAKYVLMIERDKAAVAEALRRIQACSSPAIFHVMQADLTDPYPTLMKRIQEGGYGLPVSVDAVVCNLTLHYFADSEKNLTNIFGLVKALKARKFSYTAFDGRKIFDLLQENNGVFELSDGPVLKYSIKRDYLSKTFTGIAQGVDVRLPLSQGEYYREYLLNIDLIQKRLKPMKLIEFKSFGHWLPEFEEARPDAQLTENDKLYSNLFHVAIFE
jgi:SAM-dependent methyltransferase